MRLGVGFRGRSTGQEGNGFLGLGVGLISLCSKFPSPRCCHVSIVVGARCHIAEPLESWIDWHNIFESIILSRHCKALQDSICFFLPADNLKIFKGSPPARAP
jgi:hypothetical protein